MALRSLFAPALCAVALGLGAVGCSPTFDWREVHTPRYVAQFPSRPASGTRTLPLLGTTIDLALQSSDAGDAVFAVGVADLPPALADTAEHRAAVARAFESALLNNIAGRITRASEAPLTAWDASGAQPRPELAREIEAVGERAGVRRRIVARFYLTPVRIYEVIVSTDPRVERSEPTETFLAGFRPS